MTDQGAAEKAVTGVSKQFGIIIAFLLPGFIAIWPLQYLSSTVAAWFCGVSSAACTDPSGGGFLLIVLAALTGGMLISALRWATIDQIHEKFGVSRPDFDYSQMSKHFNAYETVQQEHYRYYQYYANSILAVFVWIVGMWVAGRIANFSWKVWLIVIVIEVVLFFASRNALTQTDEKLADILGVKGESV